MSSIGMLNALIGSVVIGLIAGTPLQGARALRTPEAAASLRETTLPTPSAVRPSQQPQMAPLSPSPARALLNRYCVTCHNDRRRTGGLALDALDVAALGPHADVWEKVALKLRSGAMPPPGLPRPEPATIQALASWVEESLDRAAAANPNPGRVPAHRLNRLEYTNAVRDLLALEIDGRSMLPADDSGYGFDNIADVLSLSPALLDRYMSAAARISRLAVGDPTLRPEIKTYSVRPTYLQTERMSEELPFGTRGGLSVHHYFPVDGEYQIKIRMQRTHTNAIRGVGQRNEVELRLDRARVKTFTVGGDGPVAPWKAVTDTTYYEQSADDGLEVRMPVKAGMRQIGVAFLRESRLPEGALDPRLSVATYEYAGDRDTPMGVHTIEVSGPYNPSPSHETPSRRRIFVCAPESPGQEASCAKKILSALARRAFRRPVTDDDVRTLAGVYEQGRARGTFEDGIELALRALLVDPSFLFRVERDPAGVAPGSTYAVSQFELASRLSFFLWSSIPDDRLLDLADRGTLRNPDVLQQEVARMIDDPRADTLVSNFAGQWLYLRNVPTVAPDPEAFPGFDDNLRDALRQETELFLRSQLRENSSVLELITANYTYVNERLARHYGIPNVYGSQFRRVTFDDDTRGGLLTHGSILTVTSYANRTSPTLRGKWLLENFLGAPPPPPPPNIPALAENDESGGRNLSVRARLEQHRRNAVCASCHAPMDPMGLALENFDAIGQWRTADGSVPVDAKASLPDGFELDGAAGVRKLLLTRRGRFVETVTAKLLTYALGRGVEYYDAPAIRTIARQAAADEFRWRSLILGVVNSTPFQMRRSIEP